MTISLSPLMKDKYRIQKDLRKMDKTRTTKEERQANREKYRLEKAERRRLKTFKKCLTFSDEFDRDKKMAN